MLRKNLVIGILRETKEWERRAPLTPSDVRWLHRRGVRVEVQSSEERVFKDREYKINGAKILDTVRDATLLLGVKEPRTVDLRQNSVYMIFSHTVKGQSGNIPFLKTCIKKKITLIDYEKIVDRHGKRLVYFGRFAGICGMVDSLHYAGKKLQWKGIKNPFSLIKPAYKYDSLKTLKEALAKVDSNIQRRGLDRRLAPFIIGITGHGNVSKGVQEILEPLNPVEIHPRDMLQFVRHQKGMQHKSYKIVFFREEKIRSEDGKGFYFEEYIQNPKKFESNMDIYLPHLNILIHTSYWDKRYPRLVTKKMIDHLSGKKPFRLEFIGDISCDINGAIELTYKTTTLENPTFTYVPGEQKFVDGYKTNGVTILAVDNLPAELPGEASQEFSSLIRGYVYQIAAHGIRDITRHVAIPAELRRAVITQDGKLTRDFRYLKKYFQ